MQVTTKDFAILKERMRALVYASFKYDMEADELRKYLEELRALIIPSPVHEKGYRFSDLDYTETHNELWPISSTAERLQNILKYEKDASSALSAEIIDISTGLLYDLAYGEYKNDNWWQGDIGLPLCLSKILMMVGDKLDSELRLKLVHLMDQGSVKCRPEILAVKNAYHSGANLAWYCSNSMHRAVFLEDAEEIMMVVENMAKETVPGAYEGIQDDFSYFQHHRRVYAHGYGCGFAHDTVKVITMVAGTALAFPEYAVKNLVDYVLEGIKYLIGGGGVDYLCCGRNIARRLTYETKTWIAVVEKLLSCEGCPRAEELSDMLEKLKRGETPAEGVKLFPISKYLTCRVNGLYIAYRGSDPSLYQGECNRDENYLAINTSYGNLLCIMKHGREYSKVHTLWDYSYVPGTTSRYESDDVLHERMLENPEGFSWYKVDTEDHGCAQEGDLAVCFLGAENYGVNAVVSAFATPVGMVMLGCDLKEAEGECLHTTVNQCNANGDVVIKENGALVIHDGVAYRNLDNKTAMRASVAYKAYDYPRNSWSNGKPFFLDGNVFSLDIPTDPAHPEYAYLITEEGYAEKSVKVLRNDSEIQAIELEDGRIIAVFHKASELVTEDGKTVKGEAKQVVFC